MKTLCIIPAAGKGSRLKINGPKILYKFFDNERPIDIIINNIKNYVDEISIIIKPQDEFKLKGYINNNFRSLNISLIHQKKPNGMGDAVFCAKSKIYKFNNLLIVWGDQIGVRSKTIKRTINLLNNKNQIILPLIKTKNPYVSYKIYKKRIIDIFEKRESDNSIEYGFSDVGVFALTTNKILTLWGKYKKNNSAFGKKTKDLNFLRFLKFLNKNDWDTKYFYVNEKIQQCGLNTKNDIILYKQLLNE